MSAVDDLRLVLCKYSRVSRPLSNPMLSRRSAARYLDIPSRRRAGRAVGVDAMTANVSGSMFAERDSVEETNEPPYRPR